MVLELLDLAGIPLRSDDRSEAHPLVIAGGHAALTRSIEGAEDHPEDAVEDLAQVQLGGEDLPEPLGGELADPRHHRPHTVRPLA